MLGWFRCPSQLGVHPRLIGAGPDAVLAYVVLRGWTVAKGGALTTLETCGKLVGNLSQLPPTRAGRAVFVLKNRSLLVQNDAGFWSVVDLIEYSDSAERTRKYRKKRVTRNVTDAVTVTGRPDQTRSDEEDDDGPAGRPALSVVLSDAELDRIVHEVADYAARAFGLPGTPSDDGLRAIADCVGYGMSAEDCRAVVDLFARAPWYQKTPGRIRPATLQRMFGDYEKARAWSVEGRGLSLGNAQGVGQGTLTV